MRIESIRLKNYRAFRDVTVQDIPEFCVIVGANGTGKSTFFDVFNFLQEALRDNLAKALSRRGGFGEVVSRGQDGPIEIELKCRMSDGRLVTYFLQIFTGADKSPLLLKEVLSISSGNNGGSQELLRCEGKRAWLTANNGAKESKEQIVITSGILALKVFGYFPGKYPIANQFREFLENWHVSDIHIQNTREKQEGGHADQLSRTGDNLYQVVRYLCENEPERFEAIKRKVAERIPGVNTITVDPTPDGYLLLRFNDGNFKDPFLAKYVSDGTLKMFAYLVLLNAPKSIPLLAVEEPENQLYPKLLAILAEEFRRYARNGSQVFVSTHSPYFLDGANLDEVYWLFKKDGCTNISRAADDIQLKVFMEDGDMMGHLWGMGLFDGVDP